MLLYMLYLCTYNNKVNHYKYKMVIHSYQSDLFRK